MRQFQNPSRPPGCFCFNGYSQNDSILKSSRASRRPCLFVGGRPPRMTTTERLLPLEIEIDRLLHRVGYVKWPSVVVVAAPEEEEDGSNKWDYLDSVQRSAFDGSLALRHPASAGRMLLVPTRCGPALQGGKMTATWSPPAVKTRLWWRATCTEPTRLTLDDAKRETQEARPFRQLYSRQVTTLSRLTTARQRRSLGAAGKAFHFLTDTAAWALFLARTNSTNSFLEIKWKN